mgnify:CR=1 FL=1|jgi:hypothetical protein
MNSKINICETPYFADPTGKRDCTEAVVRALNDITGATLLSFRQTLAEMEALPSDGCHYHRGSFENRRENGVVKCVCCAQLPYLPALYFPEGRVSLRL